LAELPANCRDFGTLQQCFWSVVLGLIGGLLSTTYIVLLKKCLHAVWVTLPEAIAAHTTMTVGPYYTIAVVTCGAVLIAGLGAVLLPTGNMVEWIEKLHTTGLYPSNRLVPMLLVSFITAVSGFSIGPEAPMVLVGGILGSSVARTFGQSASVARILNMAGGAGCLSGVFGLPLCAALFVLEFPHRLGMEYYEAWPPVLLASMVSSVVADLAQSEKLGGIWNYGEVQGLLPASIVWLPLSIALVGACVVVSCVLLINLLKRVGSKTAEKVKRATRREWAGLFTIRVIVGVLVGLLGAFYPQTLFWSELTMQTALDGQATPLYPVGKVGGGPLEQWSMVEPGPGLSGLGALEVSAAKVLAIALAITGNFPGGIIFPFFFAGAYLGRAVCALGGAFKQHSTLTILCTMAVLQAGVTKTPMSTAVILMVTASSFMTVPDVAGQQILDGQQVVGAMLPLLVLTVYVGVLVVNSTGICYLISQRGRAELLPEAAGGTRAAEHNGKPPGKAGAAFPYEDTMSKMVYAAQGGSLTIPQVRDLVSSTSEVQGLDPELGPPAAPNLGKAEFPMAEK